MSQKYVKCQGREVAVLDGMSRGDLTERTPPSTTLEEGRDQEKREKGPEKSMAVRETSAEVLRQVQTGPDLQLMSHRCSWIPVRQEMASK